MARSRDVADDRFLLGPGNVCVWGHRMQTTRDHVEVPELRKVAGLDEDPVRPSEITATEEEAKAAGEPATISAPETNTSAAA